MRLALATALAVLAFATPASAQLEPAPTIESFVAGQTAPIVAGDAMIGQTCPHATMASGGRDGGAYLPLDCGEVIEFSAPQAMVELFVRVPSGSPVTLRACHRDEQCAEIARQDVPATNTWTPVSLADAGDARTIDYVRASPATGTSTVLDIDDVAFSTARQPGTEIASAPQFFESHQNGTFTFRSSVSAATYRCSLDHAEFAPCANPYVLSGLAVGAHTLAVTAVDIYGARDDRSPARADFNVLIPKGPPPPIPDADRDGVPDAVDNCPAAANTDQADGDADGVGNACDTLPPGNVPPVPGETSVVQVVSGEVFVKLPAQTRLGLRGLRAPFQNGGFEPLKGSASIPIGSTVDTRRGEVAMKSAANGYAAADRRARQQQARIKAGIFAIKQQRAKLAKSSLATDITLLSPPGAETACASGAPSIKGVVRSVSLVAKGYYRTIGGASTTTAKNASYATTDRCDGTLTSVGTGRVSVAIKGKPDAKPITVKAGRAYLVKARLFRVKKGTPIRKGGT